MSKLYKDLKYDTDWVMQPGDPLTSPDGNTSVQAVNGGKATITMPGLAEPGASLSNDVTLADLIQLLDLPETSTLDDVRSVLGLSETATLYDASVAPITKDLVTSPVKWEDVSNKPTSFVPAEHEHSAANITSGTLSVARGGTGVDGSSQAANKVLASPSSSAGAVSFRALVAADIPDLPTSKITSGTLGVARGGTGRGNNTVNAIIAANATSGTATFQNIATKSGALYATGVNGQASFGTLPVAQGGTGATSASAARTNLEITAANIPFENDQTVGAAIRDLYDTTAWVDNDVLKVGATEIATLKLANNKTVATTDQLPSGTSPLPIAQGGTGATTAANALTNLGAVAKSGDTMTGGLTAPSLTIGSRNQNSTVGVGSVSIGYYNTASGVNCIAEGSNTTASAANDQSGGGAAHSEGYLTTASGGYSHAEGEGTTASAYGSHSEGSNSVASGDYSHAEGVGTVATNVGEHASGLYNKSGMYGSKYTLSSIGFGSSSTRKNVIEVMNDGLVYVYNVGGYTGANAPDPFTSNPPSDLATAVNGKQTAITASGILKCDGSGNVSSAVAGVDYASMSDVDFRYDIVQPTVVLTTTSAPNDTAAITLQDKAVNQVSIASTVETVTFTFPPITQGKARDFILRLTILGDVPTIYFQEVGGGSITFDLDSDAWSSIEQGVTLVMFTETNQA